MGFVVGAGAMIGILFNIFALVLGVGLEGWYIKHTGTLILVFLSLGWFALRTVRQASETRNADNDIFFENSDDNVSDYRDGYRY